MSSNSKIILGILIVVIVGVGAYFIGKSGTTGTASVFNATMATTTPSAVATNPTITPAGTITLQWNNGACHVLTWSNGQWVDTGGTVNVSKANCNDAIQVKNPTAPLSGVPSNGGVVTGSNIIKSPVTAPAGAIFLEWSQYGGCLVWKYSQGNWTLLGNTNISQASCNNEVSRVIPQNHITQ